MSFEFVALNYTLPEKNQYAYKMEGFDNDWYYTDASHLSVTYTNLNPGAYIFRVKASNNDGIWNENGTEIKVFIRPPFWKTRWAYIVYFIFIVGLIYLFRAYLLYQYKLKTKIEIERINAKKTHELDQMKLDFFGNISHEFRTPLTLISGPLDYFFERQSELNWEQDHKYFSLMKRNVDRLLHMVNKVLDIRKLDSGFLNIYLKNDDIIRFVKSLTASFDIKANQKNIRFSTIFHQERYDTWFDSEVFDKIVFNLLSNAFKYTPDYGKISIETIVLEQESEIWKSEKECYELRPSSDLLKMIIKDNGIGIPVEQQEKIFDRYYQADNHSSRSGGSGIGLALVRELIDMVDGKIKLDSEVNVGSCFTIWMPIGKEVGDIDPVNSFVQQGTLSIIPETNQSITIQNQPEQKFPQSEESAEKPLILVVEDNQDMELFVSNILQNDFQILAADNGRKGFELALEHIPDLIVSDIMMPDMNGLEMCQMIKNSERPRKSSFAGGPPSRRSSRDSTTRPKVDPTHSRLTCGRRSTASPLRGAS
jgi:signal transduction histidine kinase